MCTGNVHSFPHNLDEVGCQTTKVYVACIHLQDSASHLDEKEHEVVEKLEPGREGFHEQGQARAQSLHELIRHGHIPANPVVVAPVRAMPSQLDGPRHICLQVVQVGGVVHVAQKGSDAVCLHILQAVQQVPGKLFQHVTACVFQMPAHTQPAVQF